jgi:hypothetical protein
LQRTIETLEVTFGEAAFVEFIPGDTSEQPADIRWRDIIYRSVRSRHCEVLTGVVELRGAEDLDDGRKPRNDAVR